jgi:hypothetical protein
VVQEEAWDPVELLNSWGRAGRRLLHFPAELELGEL